jgi:hypothetical protein
VSLVHKLTRRPADPPSQLFTLRWTSVLSNEGQTRLCLLYQCPTKFVCRHKCLHVSPRVGNNDRQDVPVFEQGELYSWVSSGF